MNEDKEPKTFTEEQLAEIVQAARAKERLRYERLLTEERERHAAELARARAEKSMLGRLRDRWFRRKGV